MYRQISRVMVTLFVIAMMSVLGCSKSDQADTTGESATADQGMTMGGDRTVMEGKLAFGPFTGDLPEGWVKEQPSSSMRQAQFALPVADGASDEAKVLVFYFGPDAGTVEMNITRWMGQFENADGSALTEADVTRNVYKLNNMEVTMVSFTGTQKPAAMMGAPSTEKQPGWMNASAIMMTPEGPWFFKATGPEATIQKEMAAFKQMLNSLQYSEMNAHHG
jgi:hypothetical protein